MTKLTLIILLFMMIGVLITYYDYFHYLSLVPLTDQSSYSFSRSLIFNVMAGFMGGTMGGIFLIFYFSQKFRDRPYGHGILAVILSFILIVTIITLVLGLIFAPINSGLPLGNSATNEAYLAFITDPIHLKNLVVWSIVVAATQFILQLNDKFGHGLLWDFMRGKYHSPVQETRIFMFLDLKSSTSIAEKLGNEKYYSLLKDFYGDITNAILYQKGQIYQYVGDEVVLSWQLEDGIEQNNCLICYFEMLKVIARRREKYMTKYGFVPEFKAGLHYGNVTAGEIGVIKKDVTFSGDVMNTTARIQKQCNAYQTEILISNALLNKLDLGNNYKVISIGDIRLRGKEKKVPVSTLKLIS